MVDPTGLSFDFAVEALGRTLWSGIREEWARRTSRLIRIAEIDSGLSREDLSERIREHPQLVPLVTRIVFLAGTRGSDDVLRGLGSLLGTLAENPARTDEAEVMLGVLEKLTNAHVQLLQLAKALCGTTPRVDRETLLAGAPLPDTTARLALNDLLGMDLLAEVHTHLQRSSLRQVPQYEVTSSGDTVLAVLSSIAEAERA